MKSSQIPTSQASNGIGKTIYNSLKLMENPSKMVQGGFTAHYELRGQGIRLTLVVLLFTMSCLMNNIKRLQYRAL